MSMCFFIQNFQTHYCTYSGEDHVPVGVLLFSMRARGPRGWRGGEEFSPLPPFLPHTPGRACLRAIYYCTSTCLYHCHCFNTCIFVSFVTISPVSSFQGHVACQNFTLTVPPLAVVGTMKQIHPPEGQLTEGSNAHYSTLQESESPVGIL